MKLIYDWKAVLTQAWSMRLMLLAGAFDILARAIPHLEQGFVSPEMCKNLSLIALVGAGVCRLLQQPELANARPSPNQISK
jgi:hypothetical protein